MADVSSSTAVGMITFKNEYTNKTNYVHSLEITILLKKVEFKNLDKYLYFQCMNAI